MAKGKSDIILRDRLQFTLANDSDLSLVYGRIDLSDYVNVVQKKGLNVKDIYLQVRDPNNAAGTAENTGVWSAADGTLDPTAGSNGANHWKIFVGSRAYETAADVGIASPDVLHIETWSLCINQSNVGPTTLRNYVHCVYPMRDYHPSGYPVVSDLLVGVAVDSGASESEWDNATLEVDVMLIAEPTTIGAKQMTQLLTQAQDL